MASGSSTHTEQRQDVSFEKLEIIGTGAYGSVYVAKYGDTLCAAKILHQVLFHYAEDGKSPMLERFEEECQLLRTIRHPCIVQFLDRLMDPATGLPVLLMELMDQNLTAYLDKSPQPPPYHWQVNIMHDISTALSYLHSRQYIHRDLSSNNVLLVTGACQAKLSDFGVSRSVLQQTDAMTVCPGSLVYSAPECSFSANYTEKIDVFSLGVVGIQIATCKFPQPGAPHEQVVSSPSSMLRAIPEVLRRHNHIKLIPNDHCLKEMLLNCLQDDHTKRPSSSELCGFLQQRKEESAYIESVRYSRESSNQQTLSITHKVRELSTARERLQEEVDHLRQEARTFSDQKNDYERSMSTLKTEVERLRRLQASRTLNQEPSTSSRGLLSGLFRGRELEQRLQLAEQEKRQYFEELNAAIQEHREIIAERNEARQKAASLQDDLEFSRAQLEERDRSRSRTIGKYDDLQIEYHRKCRLLEQANSRVERQATKLSELGDHLDTERQESERLRECIENRDEMVENIRLELDTERRQATQHQSSAADQQSLQGIMEYIKTTSNEQIELLKKQLSDKEKELEDSHKNVLRLEKELRCIQEQRASPNEGIKDVSEEDVHCNMCSHSIFKKTALTVSSCCHILCKSCLIEILNESKDDPFCPVSFQDSVCSESILESDICSVLDPEDVETIYGRREPDPVNEISKTVLSQQGPEPSCEVAEQTDSSFDSNSKYPPGRYDLCPAESLPEPAEVKSKLPDIHTVESDSLVSTTDAVGTKYSAVDPISQTHLASGGKGYLWTSRKPFVAGPATSAMPHGDSEGHVDTSVLNDPLRAEKLPSPPLTHFFEASSSSKTSQASIPYTKPSSSLPPLFSTSSTVANNPPATHSLPATLSAARNLLATQPPAVPIPSTVQSPPVNASSTVQSPPVNASSTVQSPPVNASSAVQSPPSVLPPPEGIPPTTQPSSVHVVPTTPPPPMHISSAAQPLPERAPSTVHSPQAHIPLTDQPPPGRHNDIPPTAHPPPGHIPSTAQHPPTAYEFNGYQTPPHTPRGPHYGHEHSYWLGHSYPHPHPYPNAYAHRPPQSYFSYPPDTRYRPRTAPIYHHEMYAHGYPPDLPPTPEYEYPIESGYFSSMGSVPPYSHRPRPFTSPHAHLHYDHPRHHPHAYTEGSIHSGHEFRNPTSNFHYDGSENTYNPHASAFPLFQSDTTSLVHSLRSSGGEDEYLAVLMQQRHIESPNDKWKVVFTVCPRTPCCVETLQELLREKFGEQFEVASFCIKFNDAVILKIPHKEIETQGYSVHTTVQPCKIARNEVIAPGSTSKVTPTYPPRHTLTISPLPDRRSQRELRVSLMLEGIEICSNQRQFCLKSPPLLSTKPQSHSQHVTAIPPGQGLAQPGTIFTKKHVSQPPLKELLQAKADTNSVSTVLGADLARNNTVIQFCQALGVDYDILKGISQQAYGQCHSNPQYYTLCEALEHWRRNHGDVLTWEKVVIALKNVREPNLVILVEEHLRK